MDCIAKIVKSDGVKGLYMSVFIIYCHNKIYFKMLENKFVFYKCFNWDTSTGSTQCILP